MADCSELVDRAGGCLIVDRFRRDGAVDAFWAFLIERHQDRSRFGITRGLRYFVGLIAVGSLTPLMTLGWERFGGVGLLAISLA